VKVYTKTADSAQAEKDYLARTGSGAWERTKPFPHAGADTFANSAQLLHDFAAAMLILAPGPDDLILDLGAAAAGVRTCSGSFTGNRWPLTFLSTCCASGDPVPLVPASARSRATCRPAVSLWNVSEGDLSQRFASCSDMRAAIGEVARVLTDDGVALFSEPGRGHAQAAHSEAAMRDFGVLEQDVLIDEFAAAASAAGFCDTRVKILSNAMPSVDVTPEEFQALTRYVSTKRPLRAMRKIARGIAEVFGLGKRSFLFGETFGISVLRVIRHASEDHPFIVASKAPLENPRQGALAPGADPC
jgi:hypothetical protein